MRRSSRLLGLQPDGRQSRRTRGAPPEFLQGLPQQRRRLPPPPPPPESSPEPDDPDEPDPCDALYQYILPAVLPDNPPTNVRQYDLDRVPQLVRGSVRPRRQVQAERSATVAFNDATNEDTADAGYFQVYTTRDMEGSIEQTPEEDAEFTGNYENAFAMSPLPNYNMYRFDLKPQDLDFADVNGTIIWNILLQTLIRGIYDLLRTFAFVPGSFWQLTTYDGDDIMSNFIVFKPPTLEDITTAVEACGRNEQSPKRLTDDPATFEVVILVYIPGTGNGGQLPSHLQNKNKAIWNPPGDTHCAPKCLAYCLASSGTRRSMRQNIHTLDQAVERFLRGVKYGSTWTYADLQKASDKFDFDVTVLNAWTFMQVFTTVSESSETERPHVGLLHDTTANHFIACPNGLDKIAKNKAWCAECRTLYFTNRVHQCKAYRCNYCGLQTQDRTMFFDHMGSAEDRRACEVCNRLVPRGCYLKHLETCTGFKVRCGVCNEVYVNKEVAPHHQAALTAAEHAAICGENRKYCSNCKQHQPPDHTCVISQCDFSYVHGKKSEPTTYVLDLEAASDKGKQVVTFASVRPVLQSLEDESKSSYTARHIEFHADNPGYDFESLDDLAKWMAGCKNCVFIAHNAQGYDAFIIHNYMRYTLGVKTNATTNGLKVMSFRWGSCKMFDSLNHVGSSLASLPKVVGLDLEGIEKDHFPHEFNTIENRNYSGPLPDLEYYAPNKGTESYEKLKEWHDAEKLKYVDTEWVLKDVERKYCRQDTYVLAMFWGEWRRLMIELTGVDPNSSVTIASFCLKVYRTHGIPEEGILTLSKDQAAFARRGLKGGRTEIFATSVEPPPDNTSPKHYIKYLDVTSLYPSVQYDEVMPFGKPVEYTEGDALPDHWQQGCGYVEVTIAPPEFDIDNPYFKPVIGSTRNGKFQFDLWRKQNIVITLVELRKCLDVGYQLDKVHRLMIFPDARDDLFKKYVRMFLKLKVESSEPPEDIDETVTKYRNIFGVELDRHKLAESKNAGARAVAKMCLNNLWGKLGQRDHPCDELVTPEGFHKLMHRHDKHEINVTRVAVDPLLDDAVAVQYTELTRTHDMTLKKTNVAIAGMVTAYGRMRLYELLGDPAFKGKNSAVRVLACDTDSVMLRVPSIDWHHPLEGELLGQWADEAPPSVNYDTGYFIAPKVYCLRDSSQPEQDVVKCKGFRATVGMKQVINVDSMRYSLQMDDDGLYPQLRVTYNNFRRQKYGGVFVGEMSKGLSFNPTSQKSYLEDYGYMIPYGPHVDQPTPTSCSQHYEYEKQTPLPPLEVPEVRVRMGSYTPMPTIDEEEELTEEAADELMQLTIARQDERREVIDYLL